MVRIVMIFQAVSLIEGLPAVRAQVRLFSFGANNYESKFIYTHFPILLEFDSRVLCLKSSLIFFHILNADDKQVCLVKIG